MTYTPNIPVSGESLGSTRVRINTNFQEIANVFEVNHVPFNDLGEGKHQFLQIPSLGSADTLPPGLDSGDGNLYVNTVSGRSELYYTPDDSGNVYQLTRTSNSSFASFATQNPGWSFLPGGLLIQWGLQVLAGNTNTNVSFPRAFNTAVYSITTTMVRNSSNMDVAYVNTVTTTDFNIRNTSSGNSAYWIAIGF